ncbi:MAG: hypothetical protein HYR78_03715 [Nitrospirae bacterium]|nr:hypothetical protein [Nitrospirota bacterium]
MPFNRTDYYVRRPAGNAMPSQCAQNTGVLYKATVNHGDGNLTEFPLVDCVADFQVVFRLDMDEDGTIGTSANADGSTVSSSEGANVATVQATLADAALLRQRLKEIRIYIIAHEGQLDATYTSASTITMDDIGGIGAFKVFDFAALGISRNYRWKLYTLVVTPTNLR